MKDDLVLLLVTAAAVLGIGVYLTRRQTAASSSSSDSSAAVPRTTITTDRLLTSAMGLDSIGRFGDTGTPDADTDVYGNPLNARARR
jgi:hypothetical protein